MLLSVQYPLADSRRFLQNAPSLDIPGWPLPTPDAEFLRFFGSIRVRRGGGIEGWVGENEICEADRAFRLLSSPVALEDDPPTRTPLRCVFKRFYFDGRTVGKFEVGFGTKKDAFLTLNKEQTRLLVNQVLHLPVQVPNPLGEPMETALAQAGKPLAQLYLTASTRKLKASRSLLQEWWVRAGVPLLFIEGSAQDQLEIPFWNKDVALPDGFGLELYYCRVPYAGGQIRAWVLKRRPGTRASFEGARLLRLYLLRLHAEHEGLRLILRHLMAKLIEVRPGTEQSEALQSYLNVVTKRIGKIESKAGAHFSEEIVEIARDSMDVVSPGQRDALFERMEEFRKQIREKVERYTIQAMNVNIVEQGGTMNTSGDSIHISGGIHGSIVNLKSELSEVSQTIGALPNADQETKEALQTLIAELTAELEKVPPANAAEAQAVAKQAKRLVEDAAEEKPNKATLQISAEGLKQAAQNIAAVLPNVLGIATQIVGHIAKLMI